MSIDDELWQEFAAESEEHLDRIERRLSDGPVLDRPGIDELFRAFHSLKGMSDALGATGMTQLAHRCEDLLGAARASIVSVAGPVVDALLASVDGLTRLRREMVDHRRDGSPDPALLAALGDLMDGETADASAPIQTRPVAQPAVGATKLSDNRAMMGSFASRLAIAAPTLARLRQTADPAAQMEANTLADAAEMLRLPRLAETLHGLAVRSGADALPWLGRLRRQCQTLAELSAEDAGAARLCAAPQAEAAIAMRSALAGLAVQLETAIAGSAADSAATVAEVRHASLVAAALGLDTTEDVLLHIEDLVERAAEPEAAQLLARRGPTLVEQLRLAAETGVLRALPSLEMPDEAGEPLPPYVPAVFGPALSAEGRRQLQHALRNGVPLYRARVAIGASPEHEAQLEAWLRDETQPITSHTVLDGPRPHLDMLLAASTPLPELLRRMERIDPAHRLMLSLEPLVQTTTERAATVTMRVRQDTVDEIIALEAEARAAALAVNEALYDERAGEALSAIAQVERHLSGSVAREFLDAVDTLRMSHTRLNDAEQRLSLALRQLDEAVLELRVVPIGTLFTRLPRVVRAVAEAGGKDVEVGFDGADVEIDRSLIELLADPLLHLVRNAVDHGIEPIARRRELGKPTKAQLHIAASRRLSQICLTVSDDGRGIDLDHIKQRAIARGLITEDAALRMSDEETRMLMFAAGFTTAETVTETSGRGVGLDVVRDAIQRVGGAVEVRSEIGRGTVFRLFLPVTAAVQTVLLVEVGGHPYALPAARVEGVLDAGEPVACPVVPLAPLLGVVPDAESPGGVVLVRSGGRTMGLRVDRIRRHTNLLLRQMHPGFAGLPAVAGLGVLGNGDPVVILEPDAMVT